MSSKKIIGGNARIVRNINRAMILNIIRESQPISRVKIAKLTKLNKSTVSSIVANLLDEGLIYEEVERDRNVGRNPLNLWLKLGQHFVGAINIDSHLTRVAVMDIDGSMREMTTIKTTPKNKEK